MKKIAILGSTGSIGTQTLEVIRENKDIEVTGLAAGTNVDLLEKQIREFQPKLVAMWTEEKAKELKSRIRDLDVKVVGDLEVDCHHTVEDTGIVLGQAIAEALGDKAGIKRYGSFLLPMDETLALCAIDLSGRPYLNFQAEFPTEHIGGLDTEMIKEFFYAVSYSAAMNLHLKIMDGGNSHHMAEALFKAFGKALDIAVSEEPRIKEVWSTKGSL